MGHTPRTFRLVEQALKGKIAEYKLQDAAFFASDIATTQRRLKHMRSQWRKAQDHPLVQQMVQVMESTVKAYLTDFYEVDIDLLVSQNFQAPFFWWVRYHGTELIFLTGSQQRVRDVKQYLRHLCKAPEREEFLKYDDAHYFVGDPATGRLIEVTRYDEVAPYIAVQSAAS